MGLGQVELVDVVLVVGCFVPVVVAIVLVALRRDWAKRRAAVLNGLTVIDTVDIDTLTQRTFAATKREDPAAGLVTIPTSRTRELLDAHYGGARRAAPGTPSARAS